MNDTVGFSHFFSTDENSNTTNLKPKPTVIWNHENTQTLSTTPYLFQPSELLDLDNDGESPLQLSPFVKSTFGFSGSQSEAQNFTSGAGNFTSGGGNFTSGDLWRENEEYARVVIPSMVYVAVLMTVGVPGNSLVMYVYGLKFRGACQHFLIVCLAVCDLIIGLIAMPTEIADLRFHLTFSSDFACRLLRFVTLFCALTSNCILIVIAVDRFRRVCHPLGRQMQKREARIGAALSAMLALLISVPLYVVTGLKTTETSRPGLFGKDCSFSDEYHDTPYPMALMCILGGGFITMTVVLAVLYFRIWRQARAHRPGLRSTRSNQSKSRDKGSSASSSRNTPPNSPAFALCGKSERRRASSTREAKLVTSLPSSPGRSPASSSEVVLTEQRLPVSVISRPDMLLSMSTLSETPPTNPALPTVGQTSCQQTPPTAQPDMLSSTPNLSEAPPTCSRVSMIGQNDLTRHASPSINASQPDVVLSLSPIPSPSLPHFAKRSSRSKKSAKKKGERSCVSSSRNSSPSASCTCEEAVLGLSRDDLLRRSPIRAISCCCHGRRESNDADTNNDVTNTTSEVSQTGDKAGESLTPGSSNVDSSRLSHVSSTESNMSVFTVRSDYDSSSESFEKAKKAHKKEARQKSKWPTCCHRNGKKGVSMDKTTVVAFAVTLVFVISFFPYLTLMLIRGVFRNFDNSLHGSTQLNFYNVFVRSYLLNSSANPVIYGVFNARFRLEVATIFRKMVSVICFCCRCSKISKC
ncbi:dopamine receptor 3-like [Littorina saxatilis]|uniref:G-protein coupled receptors family 1 profile domain-containing protein n=1 Tax=Littorina saxatilis TaxID=31220 RepID=A0AAN9AL44_9CAEN